LNEKLKYYLKFFPIIIFIWGIIGVSIIPIHKHIEFQNNTTFFSTKKSDVSISEECKLCSILYFQNHNYTDFIRNFQFQIEIHHINILQKYSFTLDYYTFYSFLNLPGRAPPFYC